MGENKPFGNYQIPGAFFQRHSGIRTMWANGTSPIAHSVVSGLHVQLSACSFLNFFMFYFATEVYFVWTFNYTWKYPPIYPFLHTDVFGVYTQSAPSYYSVWIKLLQYITVKCKRCKDYELIFTDQDMWRFWGSNKLPPDACWWLQCIYLL